VTDVLLVITPRLRLSRERLLRLCDQLREQAENERERAHIALVRQALQHDSLPPTAIGARNPAIARAGDTADWISALSEAYRKGKIRDEDLLLDATYAELRSQFALADVLRVARVFS
jgi:hypothetical protein